MSYILSGVGALNIVSFVCCTKYFCTFAQPLCANFSER